MAQPAPLAGVRVVECWTGVAGAFAGRLLALYGADVVRVELPGGDELARLGPFPHDTPYVQGGWSLFLNAGKRSVTLDITTASGALLMRRLLTETDACVEEAPVAARSRFDAVTARVPRLAVVSASPAGPGEALGSPGASRELLLQAAGGWMYAMGEPAREPLRAAGFPAQMTAGLYTAIAVLAGLKSAPATRTYDVSMLEAVTATLIYDTVAHSYTGRTRGRAGRRYTDANVLITTLPCKDGYVGLHCATQWQWRFLCEWIGHPELPADPRFRTPLARAAHIEELDRYVLPFFAERTAHELYHGGQAHRVPVSLIPTPAQVLDSPQLAARGFWAEMTYPDFGPVRVPGPAYRFDGRSPAVPPAPTRGQHNAEVYGALGLTPGDLARLRANGVV